MPATPTDRLHGLTTSVAVKPPVQISADVNVITFGEQTITTTTSTGTRTVTTEKGMRILLTNQDDPIDNGIWEAMPATWRRAPDFDGARDAVNGTMVFSIHGDCWQVEAQDPVRIGYDPIEFRSTYPFNSDPNIWQRTLRVPEPFVQELATKDVRKGKILGFNDLGNPIYVLPASGSAEDIMTELGSSQGSYLIGHQSSTVGDYLDGIGKMVFPGDDLKAALEAAEENDTIHIVGDITLSNSVTLTKAVSIDCSKGRILWNGTGNCIRDITRF